MMTLELCCSSVARFDWLVCTQTAPRVGVDGGGGRDSHTPSSATVEDRVMMPNVENENEGKDGDEEEALRGAASAEDLCSTTVDSETVVMLPYTRMRTERRERFNLRSSCGHGWHAVWTVPCRSNEENASMWKTHSRELSFMDLNPTILALWRRTYQQTSIRAVFLD
ncbi:hypothetical protein ABVT39_000194 [Epinephelus coioides]